MAGRRTGVVGLSQVPLEKVQPGILQLVKDVLEKKPQIRAILLECTELPPYADALRYFTGLPVFAPLIYFNVMSLAARMPSLLRTSM